MGVTWLQQMDESVHEGYWIYRPPGDTGHSLNEAESNLSTWLEYVIRNKPFAVSQRRHALTASSVLAAYLFAFSLQQKELRR